MSGFNKEEFSNLLKLSQGKRSLNQFGLNSNVDPGYLSRFINLRKDTPPSPEVLQKIANVAHNNITYTDLMNAAGYLREYRGITGDILDDEERKNRIAQYDYEEEKEMVIKVKNEFYTFIVNNINDKSQITDKLKQLLDKCNAYNQNLKQPELEEVIEKFVNDLMPNTNIIKCEEMLDDLGYEDRWIWENDVNEPIIFLKEKYQIVDDIEEAMKIILEQPGLMLKGELLSDESKIILANAIQMGLRTAEELEKKKNKGDLNE